MAKKIEDIFLKLIFRKRIIIIVFWMIVTSLTSSCVTKSLWGDKFYQEKISQFYVGSDSRYIVLIGPHYHYVLTDISGNLRNILSLQQKNLLTISNRDSYIKLDSNNGLDGHITFSGPFSILPRTDMYKLQSLGIFPNDDDEIEIDIKVRGRRYAAKYLGVSASSPTSQILKVYYSDSNLVKGVGKAAITPVAMTLDAVLLLGKIAFAPFKNY